MTDEPQPTRGLVPMRRRGGVRSSIRGQWVAVAAGSLLGLASLLVYAIEGYSRTMHAIWLAAFLTLLFAFSSRADRLPRPQVRDLMAVAGLVVVFAPLYLVRVYEWPVQVSSDEIAISDAAKTAANTHGNDPFGLSAYSGNPTLLLLVLGRLGKLMGGIDLANMRLLHALAGLAAVLGAYILFRQLLSLGWALVATCVVGLNHALLVISRMAEREVSALLVEVVALALLCVGLRYEDRLASFLGGVAAGLGLYVYNPGRAVAVLWVLFVLGLSVWFREEFSLRRLGRTGAVAVTGFVLVATPSIVATAKAPSGTTEYQNSQFLLTSSGRELQKDWVFASSQWDGIRTNILNGLGAFNNEVVDHGFIYENRDHGFVDPLTGALLWVGVIVVGVRLLRRRSDAWPLLPLGSFLVLWLSFAFLVNKAPNYTRMLIALPFVAYLVAEALRWGSGAVPRLLERWGIHRSGVGVALTTVAVAVIALWNGAIAWDFIDRGRTEGDDVGSTGRYIQAHRDVPGQRFYLAAGANYPYYDWGVPSGWLERMRFFAHEGQVGDVVEPSTASDLKARAPFSLFMNSQLWPENNEALRRRYPAGRLRDVTPDGRLVAFEVPAPQSVSG